MPSPTAVSFPHITETHARATYEVIRPFFDGASHTLGGIAIVFPTIADTDFAQDIRALDTIKQLTIGLFTATVLNQREVHCNDPHAIRPYAFEVRADVRRELVIAVPNNDAKTAEGSRQALRIYDMLYAIIMTQYPAFALRNIYNPVLDAVPTQVSVEKTMTIYSGSMKSEIRAAYTRI